MFSRDALPFELLRKQNVDIESTIASLTLDETKLNDLQTRASLQNGHLQFHSAAKDPYGGALRADIDLTAPGNRANLGAKIFLRDIKLNLFSGKDATPDHIPPVSVTADVRTAGASPHELAAAADGRVLLTQGPGRVQNSLIGKVSGDVVAQLFSALNPFAKHDEYSNWECTVFALDVTHGKADIAGMLAQGEKVKIVGQGKIDLDGEKLNVEFNTQPRSGVGVTADMFVTPFVKVSGTLTHPGVGLNEKGVLLAGGAAVATGGLSVLAKGAVDRMAGGIDSCDKLLDKVGGHPSLPKDAPAPSPL